MVKNSAVESIRAVVAAYHNVKTGLTTNPSLLKRRNPDLSAIPDEEVRDILKVHVPEAMGISRPPKRVQNFRGYSATRVGELIHCDLLFLNSSRNTTQKIIIGSYSYLLVAVDVYSRMIFTRLLKGKGAVEVGEAVASVVKQIAEEYYGGSTLQKYIILVDGGGEFTKIPRGTPYNYHYSVSKNKWGAVVAEYAIYKIRNKIRKITTARMKKITEDNLKDIVENLNTTLNSNLSDEWTPSEVYWDMRKPNATLKVLPDAPRAYAPGDLVRIVNYFDRKGTFTKRSSVSSYTDKIFAVLYVEQDLVQAIWQYKLISIGNNFVLDTLWYAEELMRVDPRVRKYLTADIVYDFETFSSDEEKFYKIRESKEDDFK